VSIASVNRSSLVEILSAVASVLMPEVNDDSDASQFNSSHKISPLTPDCCICCLLAKQTRSYVDASNEVAYGENREGLLKATTFIGVMETDMAEEGSRKTEVDFFAPNVNVHDSERCYLADKSPFSEYRLVKRFSKQNEPLWVVLRNTFSEYRLVKRFSKQNEPLWVVLRNTPRFTQQNKIDLAVGLC